MQGNASSTVSLESLVAKFRQNGGPANLTPAEQDRIYNHRRELGLTEVEADTLKAARTIAGR